MEWSKGQTDLIRRLEYGVIWYDLLEPDTEILSYLQALDIASPRVDIRDGLWLLTQKGEAALQELRSREEQSQKERKQEADRKAEKRNERIFQILLALLGAAAGAVLGNLDRLGGLAAALWNFLFG